MNCSNMPRHKKCNELASKSQDLGEANLSLVEHAQQLESCNADLQTKVQKKENKLISLDQDCKDMTQELTATCKQLTQCGHTVPLRNTSDRTGQTNN